MPARWLAPLVALALPAAAAAQTSPPEQTPQALFGGLVVNDPGTSPTIRALLTAGAAFVAQPTFGDLTGDGRMDAVVQVRMPGAAGTIAVYAFSTDGDEEGNLRTIFRRQAVYRGAVRIGGATLTVAAPEYATGDELCCPAARTERDYVWNARAGALRRRGAERTIRLRTA